MVIFSPSETRPIGDRVDTTSSSSTSLKIRKRRLQQQSRKIMLLAILLLTQTDIPRAPRRNLPRTNWQAFSSYETPAEFQNTYRLSRGLFETLLSKILPFVESDFIMASRCSEGPIRPEIMLALTLRMCAGGRYQDLRRLFNISKTSVYRTFHRVLQAIDHVESITFPLDDPAAMAQLSCGFDRLTEGLLSGCVGALDGYAICVVKPNKKFCQNPASYFNRKGFYSLVFQGVCDANRRFIFTSILCAGSTHDSIAWELTSLAEAMKSADWPTEYWIVGDAAYSASENLMVPLPGKQIAEALWSFNFYQSRLRINIECAFGMIWKRFLILQSPILFALPVVSLLMNVLCKLHNIIIDARLDEGSLPNPTRPVVRQIEVADYNVGSRTDRLVSHRRDALVKKLVDMGWVRPAV